MAEVAAKSLVEQVMDRIMEHVAEHKLQPGDKIPTEKELVELFGVSRSTVREAICQLQNLGVLSVRQGKGSFVRRISADTVLKHHDPLYKFMELERDELRDVMHVKKLLETEAVRLVCENITPEGLGELKKCCQRHRAAQRAVDAHELDREFHALLSRLSGNSILHLTLSLVNSFLERYRPIVVQAFEIPAFAERVLEQHRQIIAAIETGDGEQAAQAMLKHLKMGDMVSLISFDIFAEKRRLRLV